MAQVGLFIGSSGASSRRRINVQSLNEVYPGLAEECPTKGQSRDRLGSSFSGIGGEPSLTRLSYSPIRGCLANMSVPTAAPSQRHAAGSNLCMLSTVNFR